MSPKTNYEVRSYFSEVLENILTLTFLIQFLLILKIYKWTALGPKLFQAKVIGGAATSYAELYTAWNYELWPLVKWFPVAIVLDVFIRRIVRSWKI